MANSFTKIFQILFPEDPANEHDEQVISPKIAAPAPVNPKPTGSLAVLIDAENISPTKADIIFQKAHQLGNVTIQRAYGDWSKSQLKGWKQEINKHAVRPIQQHSHTTGKNATDGMLIIDAMDLLHQEKLDAICLVSSDSDFTALAARFRQSQIIVYGMGAKHTPVSFTNACNSFFFLEELEQQGAATQPKPQKSSNLTLEQAYKLLVAAVKALEQQGKQPNISSTKVRILQLNPDFNELALGFKQFKLFLEAATKQNLITIHQQEDDGGNHFVSSISQLPTSKKAPKELTLAQAHNLLLQAIAQLTQEGRLLNGAEIKPRMTQMDATFDESKLGFKRFKHFLEDAAEKKTIRLERGQGGDLYVCTDTQGTKPLATTAKQPQKPEQKQSGEVSAKEIENSEQLVKLVYWTIWANNTKPEVTLTDVGVTIRMLDPTFTLQKYGYSKSQKLKKIFEDLAKFNLIRLEYHEDRNIHTVKPTLRYEAFMQGAEPTETEQVVRYQRMIAQLDFISSGERLLALSNEARTLARAAWHQGTPLTAESLLQATTEKLVEAELDNPVRCRKLFLGLLRSGSLKNSFGQPIHEMSSDEGIYVATNDAIIIDNYCFMLKNLFNSAFSEDPELTLLKKALALPS